MSDTSLDEGKIKEGGSFIDLCAMNSPGIDIETL